jgi:hypothetical protein
MKPTPLVFFDPTAEKAGIYRVFLLRFALSCKVTWRKTHAMISAF